MSDSYQPWLRPFRLPNIEPPNGLTYEELEEFGAQYDSSMSEINQAGLNAQRSRQLTPARKRVWRQLRDSENRLMLDFLHIQTDPAAWGDESGIPPGVPEPKPPEVEIPAGAEPTQQEIVAALGPVDVPPMPELSPSQPPPLLANVWELLDAVLPPVGPEPPPIPEPGSFLKDET